MGAVSKGHLVEADRSRLVAGYVGQTAIKVREVAESAIGGVLFIDEAYSLEGDDQDYGHEAIETIIKLMEDHRDDLIVIVAGYPDKMNSFIRSNPGLQSRFNKYFHFPDYSPHELVSIFYHFCKQAGYTMSKEAIQKLQLVFETLCETRGEDFGNARLARNIFEMAINNQANRIISIPDASEEHLSAIYTADIPSHVELQNALRKAGSGKQRRTLGFK